MGFVFLLFKIFEKKPELYYRLTSKSNQGEIDEI